MLSALWKWRPGKKHFLHVFFGGFGEGSGISSRSQVWFGDIRPSQLLQWMILVSRIGEMTRGFKAGRIASLSYVDLQTIFGFEVIITLAALKSLLHLAGWFHVSWIFLCLSFFPFQVVFFPLQVSSLGWRTLLLLLCFKWSDLHLGVQREGEWGAKSEVESESMALARQCLAEFQALSG